jgi:hypothetical protein
VQPLGSPNNNNINDDDDDDIINNNNNLQYIDAVFAIGMLAL